MVGKSRSENLLGNKFPNWVPALSLCRLVTVLLGLFGIYSGLSYFNCPKIQMKLKKCSIHYRSLHTIDSEEVNGLK